MTLTDAEILDIVRKLRTYMSALDNSHHILGNIEYIGDQQISTTVRQLLPKILDTSKSISITLKMVENSKAYRTMLSNFNLEEDDE